QPGLMLLQDANDLLCAEPASLHRLSPRLENRPTSKRGHFSGASHKLPVIAPFHDRPDHAPDLQAASRFAVYFLPRHFLLR
ncbi:hypothetical protein, partial [Rhodovulum sulfidophilum]|uniref:hypothetical protein n=1 Tax=Rhodovulum sulfidophilum TaxID=35806 RepID=UPI001F47EEDE